MNRINKSITLYKFVVLFMLFLNIWLSFSVIYCILDITDLGPIVDHYASKEHQSPFIDIVTRSLYFSAITQLSVGYGDITPFGLSKAVAILQALIGYILPAVLVIQLILPPTSKGEIKVERERSSSF